MDKLLLLVYYLKDQPIHTNTTALDLLCVRIFQMIKCGVYKATSIIPVTCNCNACLRLLHYNQRTSLTQSGGIIRKRLDCK